MQPEAKFKQKVKRRLDELNDMYYYCTQEMSRHGTPDIIGCYRGLFFAWELKTETGRVSKIQEVILERISVAGGLSAVVTPSTLDAAFTDLLIWSAH